MPYIPYYLPEPMPQREGTYEVTREGNLVHIVMKVDGIEYRGTGKEVQGSPQWGEIEAFFNLTETKPEE